MADTAAEIVDTGAALLEGTTDGKDGSYIAGTTDSLSLSPGYLYSVPGSIVAGGGSTDITRPVISNLNPTPGTPISTSQVISFDVTDNLGLFTRIIIIAVFGTAQEVVHDGANFAFIYQNASSTVTPITNGFHYTVLRSGGWPASVTFEPFAIDVSGNENA